MKSKRLLFENHPVAGALRWHLASRLAIAFVALPTLPSSAAPVTWIGGNVDWDTTNANWNPADEPDADDEAIFNTPNTVNIAIASQTIQALTLSGGIDLLTNDNDLVVDGLVQLVDASTVLAIGGSTSLLTADSANINAGGTMRLTGGVLTIIEETDAGALIVNTDGTLTGNGTINLNDLAAAGTVLMTLSGGSLVATSNTPGDLFGTDAATLTINLADTDTRIDLDNISANVSVNRNDTLAINGLAHQAGDPYSGTLNLGEGATLNMEQAWQTDSAIINVNTGGVFSGSVGAPATITGGAFTFGGGTINLDDVDSLRMSAPFTTTAGTIANAGHVIFNANSTIGAGTDFQMTGSSASLTVETGVTVNIDDADFNADGSGAATNVITIKSGGILDIDMGVGGETGIGSTLNLNGGELDVTTDTNTWSLDGVINVGAATGTSTINGEALTFTSVPVTVGNGSILDVNAVSTWSSAASASVGTGSTLRIDGLASVLAGASFTGAGTLVFGSTSTTSASTTVSTNTFDWDGAGSGTTHTINDGVVFTVASPVFDTDGDMDDGITLGASGSSIVISGPTQWEMNHTITSNTADTGVATIGGTSRLVLTSAGGILNANGDSTISAPVTFGPSSTVNVAAPAILTVTGNAIYDGVVIDGAGNFNPPTGNNNTVATNSTIGTANFNFDGGNWVIQAGATLSVNVNDYDPDIATNAFGNTITIQSGIASVISGDPFFVMDGVLNLNNTAASTAIWTGEPLHIGNDASSLDADLNVGGTGNSSILPQVTFNSDADVDIAAGASLSLVGIANFDSVNAANNAEFTGTGTLITSGQVNFNEATTINMTGGTVDLDGADSSGSTINVDAPVTINVATLNSFGKSNAVGTNIIEIDSLAAGATGLLTVNLDNPAFPWVLNAQGQMDLLNDAVPATLLAGVDVILRGTVNVTGEVQSDARFDLTGTINILTAGQHFRMGGGNNTNDPNTIDGGIINGPGRLGNSGGRALVGDGTINSDIEVGFNSDVLADGGTLTVTSPLIFSVKAFGTADTDGILNVVPNWDAANVSTILMTGGQLTGGAIQNNATNGIRGHGLVAARVVNNTGMQANNALAPLIVETAANTNDWDGGAGFGTLQAVTSGTLEVRDNAVFPFTGTVSANGGGTVYANGFELDLSLGTLSLANGTFRQSGGLQTDLGGTITIGAGTSKLFVNAATGGFLFEPTASTTLTGNLELDAPSSVINAGATFGGAGHLINLATRRLSPDNLTTINALVENRGIFSPGGAATAARNDLLDFAQSATGVLEVDLRGTVLGNFDRVLISGSAQLAGNLQLAIGGGYVPALGDSFTVLSATGGVSGTFSTVFQPVGMPAGRVFQVTYNPGSVVLTVVAASPFDLWIATFPSLINPADKTKAADPDFDGISNLGEFALDGNPASSASSGKVVGKIGSVGGVNAMTLTIPVRNGAVLDGADPAGGELVLKQTSDGLTYRLQATDDLTSFGLEVTEVAGPDATAIQTGLPSLTAGWIYRSFRSPGGVSGDPLEFMRVVVTE